MELSQLNGLTPQQLLAQIQKSPTGFSVADNCIQYLGRPIQLNNQTILLSELNQSHYSKQRLLARLTSMQPEVIKKLPDSEALAMADVAKNLLATFGAEAIQQCTTQALKHAVILESFAIDYDQTFESLAQPGAFSPMEKFQLLWTFHKKHDTQFPYSECYKKLDISPLNRFEMIKDAFQRLPAAPPFENNDSPINGELMQFDSEPTLARGLQWMREIIGSADNKLSQLLMPEIDKIKDRYSRWTHGTYWFLKEANSLLYLYAACSGFSEKADISELSSYIISVFRNDTPANCWHIARELAFLARQPGSVGYSRYIHAVARKLRSPLFTVAPKNKSMTVTQFEQFNILNDTSGFGLLEGNKTLTPYLSALKTFVTTETPEISEALQPEIDKLAREFSNISLPEDRPDIKERVHKLLLVIAACTTCQHTEVFPALSTFVTAVIKHKNQNNFLHLVRGLACLVQSPPKTQHLFSQSATKGGDHVLLAPLALVWPLSEMLFGDDVEAIIKQLQGAKGRRTVKDAKVFHQWLVTMDKIHTHLDLDKASLGQILQKLTLNMPAIYDKLGLLDIVITAGAEGRKMLERLGFTFQAEETLLGIAEKGTEALSQNNQPTWRWLLQQRHAHLLPIYLHNIMTEDYYISEKNKTELIELIFKFADVSARDEFVKSRQSPHNNPHLEAIYQHRDDFGLGWRANLTGFSPDLCKRLNPGNTLELTEDPWDLFISGFELHNCQSPDGFTVANCALMGYVMDGRNAMIVKKNSKGNILARAVIRIVLNKESCPALFIENIYPNHPNNNNNDDKRLFRDAAREIAQQLKLSVYQIAVVDELSEDLKCLEGSAPYDYFDSLSGVVPRGVVAIKGTKLRDSEQQL